MRRRNKTKTIKEVKKMVREVSVDLFIPSWMGALIFYYIAQSPMDVEKEVQQRGHEEEGGGKGEC